MKYIKDILKGMLIGVANAIPGVSGGTMMVSMGIYDDIIYCVTHLLVLHILLDFCWNIMDFRPRWHSSV